MASLVPGQWAQEAANQPKSAPPQQNQSGSADAAPSLPRGKKLILKDGSFHLVREYEIQGDRVRYYSVERSQWEEIPAALVDWDVTRKVEAEESRRDAAVVAKVHKQEEVKRIEPLDIDASLEAAPGVFIPPGEGLFAFDGKTVSPLSQAETGTKTSKARVIEQVLIPVHVVPSRRTVSIQNAHAKFRIKNGQPEFYMRTADEREPLMDLIRAKVHGDSRVIENLDTLFKREIVQKDTLPMQRWQVAIGVYRFTLGQPLEPGEYAFVEIVKDGGMNLYVWDFGVDAAK